MLQIIALALSLCSANIPYFMAQDSETTVCHDNNQSTGWTVCYNGHSATFLHDDFYEGQQPMVIVQNSAVVWMSPKFERKPRNEREPAGVIVYEAAMLGDDQDDGAILVINSQGKIKDLHIW